MKTEGFPVHEKYRDSPNKRFASVYSVIETVVDIQLLFPCYSEIFSHQYIHSRVHDQFISASALPYITPSPRIISSSYVLNTQHLYTALEDSAYHINVNFHVSLNFHMVIHGQSIPVPALPHITPSPRIISPSYLLNTQHLYTTLENSRYATSMRICMYRCAFTWWFLSYIRIINHMQSRWISERSRELLSAIFLYDGCRKLFWQTSVTQQ